MLYLIAWLSALIGLSSQHARLMEPPSRSSMWRLGFPNPKNQDDNQLYCGGFGVQYNQNGGRCGICGDPWHIFPRPHEAPGGIYANGIITKSYRQGAIIPVIVDITANHQGYFEFKLCPNNDIFLDPDQSCFNAYPLQTGRNRVRFPIHDYETGLRLVYVRLPWEVTCDQCILQWSYVGGNNWGTCENGTAAIGCGDQETFRACADIEIVPHPLLTSLNKKPSKGHEYYDQDDFVDEDHEDNFGDDFDYRRVEEKESQLRKKKILLERVLQKVRDLILLSQESQSAQKSDDSDGNSDGTKEQVFAKYHDASENEDAWWERIVSNRH